MASSSSSSRPPKSIMTEKGFRKPLVEIYKDAVLKDDDILVEKLFQNGLDPNHIFQQKNVLNGKPLIYFAIQRRASKVIKKLVEHKVKLNPVKEGDFSPLAFALQNNTVMNKDLKLLITLGANIKELDQKEGKDGSLNLLLKSRTKDNSVLIMVKYLIEQGAEIDHIGQDGFTPLMLACINRDKEVMKWFLYLDANINAVDFSGNSMLFHCVNHFDTYKLNLPRLKKKPIPGVKYSKIFKIYNYEKIIKYILDEGIDIYIQNNRNLTILHHILYKTKEILNNDNFDEEEKSILEKEISKVFFFILNNWDDDKINLQSTDGYTLFHLSISLELYEYNKILASHIIGKSNNFNINLKNNHGVHFFELLLDADFCNSDYIIALLRKYPNFDINQSISSSTSHSTNICFLSGLCFYGNRYLKAVKFLLSDEFAEISQQQIDVNYRDDLGNSPVFYSVTSDEPSYALTELLITSGAEISIPNANDMTPICFLLNKSDLSQEESQIMNLLSQSLYISGSSPEAACSSPYNTSCTPEGFCNLPDDYSYHSDSETPPASPQPFALTYTDDF